MKNTLYTNDNLYVMVGMNSESVDLIYLDPPFNSKRTYSAPIGTKAAGASFKDMWTWKDIDESFLESLAEKYPELATYIASAGIAHSKTMMAYLTYMAQRIIEMHRILKDTGSLYLHCDPTASHYLKELLDIIFGKNNFVNEIIWYYKNASRGKKKLAKAHDIIFWYAKNSDKYMFYRDNVLVPFESGMTQWRYSKGGQAGKEMPTGKTPDDVFVIPSLNAMDRERTGYPTQKPLALLRRIIQLSSKEKDIIFDPFCGCATACVAAQQLQRNWIGIDIEEQAVGILIERLSDDNGIFSDFVATKIPPKRTDVKETEITKSVKEKLYLSQEHKCNGCGNEFRIMDLEIDHIIPKAKGGGDYYENYQLLCGNCNRMKGNRPMEYLRTKIATREKIMKNKIIFGD